jgi:hypothetical protein
VALAARVVGAGGRDVLVGLLSARVASGIPAGAAGVLVSGFIVTFS